MEEKPGEESVVIVIGPGCLMAVVSSIKPFFKSSAVSDARIVVLESREIIRNQHDVLSFSFDDVCMEVAVRVWDGRLCLVRYLEVGLLLRD